MAMQAPYVGHPTERSQSVKPPLRPLNRQNHPPPQHDAMHCSSAPTPPPSTATAWPATEHSAPPNSTSITRGPPTNRILVATYGLGLVLAEVLFVGQVDLIRKAVADAPEAAGFIRFFTERQLAAESIYAAHDSGQAAEVRQHGPFVLADSVGMERAKSSPQRPWQDPSWC
ncbi:hypothetical protein [Nocardia sp. NPDC059229]|uniref:hypothetical protein n=1 Tax=Nocardia sp. NPDC059229 TaxID=3346778 RepID=UPI0036944A5A